MMFSFQCVAGTSLMRGIPSNLLSMSDLSAPTSDLKSVTSVLTSLVRSSEETCRAESISVDSRIGMDALAGCSKVPSRSWWVQCPHFSVVDRSRQGGDRSGRSRRRKVQ